MYQNNLMHIIKFTFLKGLIKMQLVVCNNTKENFFMGAREKECQISQNYILIHMKFSQFACVFTIRRKFDIHFLGFL